MDHLTIANFRYGLDARREQLVAQPGTLVKCENAHINSGGEIEKRKAFSLPAAYTFPTNCFGLQDTDSGLMTFGGDAAPNGPLPTGVVYQRLVYPGPLPQPMTAVVFSCAFQGKAFVIATYSTSGTYVFYNGVLVNQITDGFSFGEFTSVMSTELAAMVNNIPGWLAHANVTGIPYTGSDLGYQESALSGSTLVMSPPGVHFTPSIPPVPSGRAGVTNSVAGVLGWKLVDQNYPGRAAMSASVAFQLTGGASGSVQVSAPKQAGSQNPVFDLTNGPIGFTTTLGQLSIDVAAAINNNTFLTGYTAVANSGTATVTVYAPSAFGAMTLNLVITTVTVTVGAGSTANKFSLQIVPSIVDVLAVSNTPKRVYGVASASTSGAVGVVTFLWSEVNTDGTVVTTPSGIQLSSTTAPNPTFSTQMTPNTVKQGFFKCVATDAGGASGSPATAIVTVKLELDSSN